MPQEIFKKAIASHPMYARLSGPTRPGRGPLLSVSEVSAQTMESEPNSSEMMAKVSVTGKVTNNRVA